MPPPPCSLVVDAESVEDVQEGCDEGKERCRAVELVVVEREPVFKLRRDCCVGLQDSSTHIQNGCGTVVQTIQHFPVVAVSVKAEDVTEEEQQGDEAGCDGHVHHPSLLQWERDRGSSNKDPDPGPAEYLR